MGRNLLIILMFYGSLCQGQWAPGNSKKTSISLARKLQEEKDKDQVFNVTLSFRDLHSLENYKRHLQVIKIYAPANILVCSLTRQELNIILKDSTLLFAELRRRAKTELTTGSLDLSVNKINLAHHLYPEIRGEGIRASIKEQRFDTTDVDIANRYFSSLVADPIQSSHASIMATTLAGAGNSSSYGKGAAPAAAITSSSFEILLPDDESTYTGYHISIQNHSYGTSIENFYGADAAAYDASVFGQPELLHVFSAGNAGLETSAAGNYAGIPGVANMTGSFKMAKNIITVGAVDSFGVVAPQSSRGPAFDGRIKPELVAFGNDGSSGAAALVSGTAALVQDAYRQLNGKLPPAALVKAILLNSADDRHAHPGYSYGYGNLDANASIKTVFRSDYAEGSILKNQTIPVNLQVPPGCGQLKVTLVWTDPPAIANATKALVNDLDATLVSPANEVWEPWVPDPFPDKSRLELAPVRKTDTLNNVEQISVDSPLPGTYTLKINGNKIRSSEQSFAIAWSFDSTNMFRWTYPTGEDVFETGTTHILKWETTLSGTGTIEFSTGGNNWQTVQSDIDLSQHTYSWTAPDTLSQVRFRMSANSAPGGFQSDEFVVSPGTALTVGFDCMDSFLLKWNSAANTLFQVYELADKYIQPFLVTTESFVVLNKQQHTALHYAVIPSVNGRPGLQSYLIDYTTQGVGCYFQSFYATLDNNATSLEINLGTLFHVKEIVIEKQINGVFTGIFKTPPAGSTSIVFSDRDLQKGLNRYRAAIILDDGSVNYSPAESVLFFPREPVIVYPNPVRQNQTVHLIVKEPGIYTFTIHDLQGRFYAGDVLADVTFNKSAGMLGKGIYIVRFTSRDGASYAHKLVVY